jgi:hypothetical protein
MLHFINELTHRLNKFLLSIFKPESNEELDVNIDVGDGTFCLLEQEGREIGGDMWYSHDDDNSEDVSILTELAEKLCVSKTTAKQFINLLLYLFYLTI